MSQTPRTAEVLVLDVDDTLYLEREYVRSGFRTVGAHIEDRCDVEGVGDTLWSLFLDGVRGETFDRALAHHGIPAPSDLVVELVEIYREHHPDIRLLPDSQDLIGSWPGPLAVITDGPVASQRAKTLALGLHESTDLVVLTAELGPDRGKPHPAAFELVERHFGCSGSSLAYVADNPAKDFDAPRDRGWGMVRVRRPASLHRSVPTPPDVPEVEDLAAGARVLGLSGPRGSASRSGVEP